MEIIAFMFIIIYVRVVWHFDVNSSYPEGDKGPKSTAVHHIRKRHKKKNKEPINSFIFNLIDNALAEYVIYLKN